MSFWPVVKRVIKDSDIVMEVIDARTPDLSRNYEVERLVRRNGKIFVLLFNKCDLISRKRLDKLKKENKGAFFVSGKENLGMSRLKKGLLILASREKIKNPMIGIVGYPNTGKSAVINALAKGGRAKVSGIAGTTKGIQWINAGSLKILDSPGVVPFEDSEVKLGILGAKNPEKIKKLDRVVFQLIKQFIDSESNSLENFYGISINEEMDEYDILLEIGKARNYLVKGGKVDEHRTMYQFMRDWQSGRLSL